MAAPHSRHISGDIQFARNALPSTCSAQSTVGRDMAAADKGRTTSRYRRCRAPGSDDTAYHPHRSASDVTCPVPAPTGAIRQFYDETNTCHSVGR